MSTGKMDMHTLRSKRSAPARTTSAQPDSHLYMASASTLLDRTWLHVCTLIALPALVFANSLGNSFHLDDYYRVVNNPGITQISQPWRHFVDPSTMSTVDRIGGYRPFLPLTLSINYALSGDSVVGYHLGNLALQILAACLLYALVPKLLAQATTSRAWPASRSRAIAWCVALLFAVHPVSGISVNYICARDQQLSQAFLIASLLGYFRMLERGESVRRWALTLLLLAASLLSKGDAVLAPALMLALQFTILGRPFRKLRPWLHSAAFALPVASLFLVQTVAFGRSEVVHVVAGTDRWTYMLTQARLHLFRYLPQFVWPFPIHQDPAVTLATGLSADVVCGLLFIVGSLVLAIRWRKTQPIWAFCILAYWVMIAPTSSVIPLFSAAVDYRPYPSSPFLFLGLTIAALRIALPLRTLLAVGAIAWCAGTSFVLNRTWRDDASLWSYSVKYGGSALAYNNLALVTPDLKTKRALFEQAVILSPNYILAMINLGRTMISQGETIRGIDYVAHAVGMMPSDPQYRYWYARTLSEVGRTKDASRESVAAAHLDPRNPQTVLQAVLATKAAGDTAAQTYWTGVLRNLQGGQVETSDPHAGFERGYALQQLGKLDEAIVEYRAYLKVHPDQAQAHFNLACAFLVKEQYRLAIPEFERSLQLDPNKKAAHLHLATCLRALGDPKLAQQHQQTWDESQKVSAR